MKTIKELKKTAQELGLSNDAVRQHGDLRRKPTWEKAIAARESIVDSLERIYNSPSVSVGVEAIEMFKESFVRPVSAPVPEPEPEEEGDRENPPGESQEISEQAVTPVLEPEPEEGKLVSPWWLPDKNKASAIATAYCNSVGVIYDDFVSEKLEYWLLVSSCDCLFSDTTFTFFVRQNESRGLLDWLNAAKAGFGKKLVPFDDYWIFVTDLRPWTILELSLALDTPIYLKNHLDHWDPKCGSLIEPKYFCSDLPYKYYHWGIQVDVELPIQGFMPAEEIPQHIWTPMPEPEPEEGGERDNSPGESQKNCQQIVGSVLKADVAIEPPSDSEQVSKYWELVWSKGTLMGGYDSDRSTVFYISEQEDHRGLLNFLIASQIAKCSDFYNRKGCVFQCWSDWKPWELIELAMNFDTPIRPLESGDFFCCKLPYEYHCSWGLEVMIRNPHDGFFPAQELQWEYYGPLKKQKLERWGIYVKPNFQFEHINYYGVETWGSEFWDEPSIKREVDKAKSSFSAAVPNDTFNATEYLSDRCFFVEVGCNRPEYGFASAEDIPPPRPKKSFVRSVSTPVLEPEPEEGSNRENPPGESQFPNNPKYWETVECAGDFESSDYKLSFYVQRSEDRGLLDWLIVSQIADCEIINDSSCSDDYYRCRTDWRIWQILDLSIATDTPIHSCLFLHTNEKLLAEDGTFAEFVTEPEPEYFCSQLPYKYHPWGIEVHRVSPKSGFWRAERFQWEFFQLSREQAMPAMLGICVRKGFRLCELAARESRLSWYEKYLPDDVVSLEDEIKKAQLFFAPSVPNNTFKKVGYLPDGCFYVEVDRIRVESDFWPAEELPQFKPSPPKLWHLRSKHKADTTFVLASEPWKKASPVRLIAASVPEPEPEPEEGSNRENPPGESQEISKQIVVPEPERKDSESQTWQDWELVKRYPDYENDDRFRFYVLSDEPNSQFFVDWVVVSEAAKIERSGFSPSCWWASVPCLELSTTLKPWEILNLSLALEVPILPRTFNVLIEQERFAAAVDINPFDCNPIRGFASILPYRHRQDKLVVHGRTSYGFAPAAELSILPCDEEQGENSATSVINNLAHNNDEQFSADANEVDVLPIGTHPRNRAIAQKLMSKFGLYHFTSVLDFYPEGWGHFKSPWEEVDLGYGWRTVATPGSRLSQIDDLEIEVDGEIFIIDYENVDSDIADLTVECELAQISACIEAAASEWGKQFGKQLELFEGEVSYATL